MPLSNRTTMLRALKGFDTDIKAVLRTVADQARGRLTLMASADGTIHRRSLPLVQRDVGQMIERVFVSADGRSAYGADGVTPLSPFARTLNKWAVRATVQIVTQHSIYIANHIPDDVAVWLSPGRRFIVEQVASERLLSPQAFVEYESTWTWLDQRGYQLSDRIWNTALETRRRVDALLADGIRSGRPALSIARELEQFLMPGRAALRTSRPYGQDVSFYAMRLARTEITRQAGQVFLAASRQNPFVEAINWNISGSHPKADECDTLAAGSPYELNNVPDYPAHPHCLCYLTTVTRPQREVVDELRVMMDEGEQSYVTPLDMRGFLEQMLGVVLAALALRELVQS